MDHAALQVLHHVLEARRAGSTEVANMPGADLRGAQLLRADLVGAQLAGAGLDHAQLAGSKLGAANLQGTLLRHADLAGADLTSADLRGADLSHARLEGASLAGADLRGACIEAVIGEPSTIAGVIIDQAFCERSRLPETDIVHLWHAGAVIHDIEHFGSMMIRTACAPAEVASDAGPPERRISTIEMEARRQRLGQDEDMPPSARVSLEVMKLVVPSGRPRTSDHPLSMRSLKLVTDSLTPEMVRAPEWQEGDKVMGMTLERVIGRGNAAVVWRATDADGEQAAVKLFSASRLSHGLTLPAYRRGVVVMNRLTAAEGVVPLRCVSLNKLGMVMEYAPNGSAVDLPALGWDVKSALSFFQKLCRVVQRAHAAGALHRCLKPSNILLDADLQPMLMDFDMVDLPTLAAASNDVGGYAAYAAPEELLDQGTQSPTVDVYSLGRFLAFLLSGADPEEPARDVPELASLTSKPAGIVRIVRKCTMRAPEARYQQVDELLADIGRFEAVGGGDGDNVGLGGLPEASYMPYRVSSLAHRTPWLGRRAETPKPAPPRGAGRERPRRQPKPVPQGDPLGLSRNGEKVVGLVGALGLLVSIVSVLTAGDTPTPSLVTNMHYVSVAGGALMTFLVPRATSHARFWRLVFVVMAATGLYIANLPGLAAPPGTPAGKQRRVKVEAREASKLPIALYMVESDSAAPGHVGRWHRVC